ncbi:MAG: hypothetical protein IPI67_03035 [Myxococcales bacterium]|nr:hypothetical protein [Myxococcales bacterium]
MKLQRFALLGFCALLGTVACGGGDEGGGGGKKDAGKDGSTGGTGGGSTGGSGGTSIGGAAGGGGASGSGGSTGGAAGSGGAAGAGGATGGAAGAGGATGGAAGAGGATGGTGGSTGGAAGAGGATGGTGGATGGTGGSTGGTGGATGGTGGTGTGGAAGTGGTAGDGGAPECVSDGDCDNGAYCDGVEKCVANKCTPGTAIVCPDDGKSCTSAVCDETSTSCKVFKSDGACDDGLYCNGIEACDPTNAQSNSTTGCTAGTPVACDDSFSCTVDSCNEGSKACVHTASNNACSNGLYCDGAETCAPGTSGANPTTGCVAGTAPNCEDGLACTTDSCDEVNDTCQHVGDDSKCQDGLYCNGAESCDVNTGCKAGAPINCPNVDGLACTVETCNEATDTCDTAIDNTKCTGGQVCIPPTGCVTQACTTAADCTDGNACNGLETCDTSVPGGQCKPGTPVNCNDGVACTLDECNTGTGACTHTPFNAFCSDGNLCNGIETCNVTTGCQAGTPLACNDNKSCTIDSCLASIGCFYQPNDAACQDASQCNGAEACNPSAGNANATTGCVPSPGPLSCGAPVGCATKACVEGIGCQSVGNDDLCNQQHNPPQCGYKCDAATGQCSNTWCKPGTCQGKTYACGDCIDNDGDCKVDSQDESCLGTCSDNEGGFKGEIPGQNNAACKMDCYFDADSGGGNDDCNWDHRCDTNQPQLGDGCTYDPTFKFPGNKSCADYRTTQSAQCAGNMNQSTAATGYCGPLVPNGCDCFGCCVFPQLPYPDTIIQGVAMKTGVYLGSSPTKQSAGTCTMAVVNAGNPGTSPACHKCAQVPSCANNCDVCEICVGKPTLPPQCTEQTCPTGKQECGLPGQGPCPTGEYCVTGCCTPNPS